MPNRIGIGGPFLVDPPTGAFAPIEEPGDSWWGQQLPVVPRALAATAALSLAVSIAGGFNYGEEIVPWLPSETASTPAGTQRERVTPRFHNWAFSEELPTAITFVAEEESFVPQAAPQSPISVLWTLEQEFAPVVPEEESWFPPQLATATPKAITFVYEEDLPRLLLDEEYWSRFALPQYLLPASVPSTEEDAVFAQFTLEEEYWFTQGGSGSIQPPNYSVSDEDLPITPIQLVEEEYQFYLFPYLPPLAPPLPGFTEEISTPLFVEEEYWWPDQRFVTIIPYTPIPKVISDDIDQWPTPFVPPPFDASIKFDITTGMLVKPLSAKIVMLI